MASAQNTRFRPAPAANPVTWHAVAFGKTDSLDKILGTIGVALLAQLRANHGGALQGADPEYLHQLRVAARRLRVLLLMYSGLRPAQQWAAVSREAKWLAHKLGPARDCDVFVDKIWPHLRRRLPPGPIVDALGDRWHVERRQSGEAARTALRSRRYRRFMLKLEKFFTDGSLPGAEVSCVPKNRDRDPLTFARAQLRLRAKRVANFDRRWAAMGAKELHRLRIAVKKLRYVAEFLGPLYKSKRVTKILKRLSTLQNVLGAMNDIEVANARIAAALKRRAADQRERLGNSLHSWRRSKLKALRNRARSAWKNYSDIKPFW